MVKTEGKAVSILKFLKESGYEILYKIDYWCDFTDQKLIYRINLTTSNAEYSNLVVGIVIEGIHHYGYLTLKEYETGEYTLNNPIIVNIVRDIAKQHRPYDLGNKFKKWEKRERKRIQGTSCSKSVIPETSTEE